MPHVPFDDAHSMAKGYSMENNDHGYPAIYDGLFVRVYSF